MDPSHRKIGSILTRSVCHDSRSCVGAGWAGFADGRTPLNLTQEANDIASPRLLIPARTVQVGVVLVAELTVRRSVCNHVK